MNKITSDAMNAAKSISGIQTATVSVTEAGRHIINQAIELSTFVHPSKATVTFRAVICGNSYYVDLDEAVMNDPKGIELAWANIFIQFEKDLDKGVSENTERIITL